MVGTGSAWAQVARNFGPGNVDFLSPENWSVEARGQKLNLVNPNEDAFVVFVVLKDADPARLKVQIGQALASQFEDVAVADDGQRLEINGVKALALRGNGSSDANPIAFRAVVLTPANRPPVMVLAYTTPANFPAMDPAFTGIFQSLALR